MKSPVDHVLPLAALLAIASGGQGAAARPGPPSPPVAGPAADYPVVLGDSFTVDGQTFTPADKLNYDEVGHAAIDASGGTTITAAHKTLPLPSYVEVTSLASGRTILVRVERRGPMSADLIELSAAAAAQLDMTARSAVRVRRVNPPEPERALLRTGKRAPERMATPKGLLDALNRKLARLAAPATPKPSPPTAARPEPGKQAARPRPAAAEAAPPAVSRSAAASALTVQVAAFSTRARADAAAARLGAAVSPAGRFWRVRLGPFATRGEAEAALAKAARAGYSDARIQRAD